MTKTGPLGTFLVDGQGKSLYVFAADTGNTSNCNGACAAAFPPFTANGTTPSAGSGVDAGMLSTTTRQDGTKQVTFSGHPIYSFTGDRNPGDTNGQGLNNFGGQWWLVTPSGMPITGTGGATPSGTTTTTPGRTTTTTTPGGTTTTTTPGGTTTTTTPGGTTTTSTPGGTTTTTPRGGGS
jgi:predicted lipoprotein with Yx(FWY)xxD motif